MPKKRKTKSEVSENSHSKAKQKKNTDEKRPITKGYVSETDDSMPDIPRDISFVKFAEARAAEIRDLAEECQSISGASRVFQRLPHDLRRRSMSHLIKRLPRRLQPLAAKEYDNQVAKKKRPSRKHRRRPSNLQTEYARRQRKIRWLETHIWHAKRFHMVTRWGYKLPLHATNKCYRSCYRASLHRCLIQDVSYMECIEVCGSRAAILSSLSHLTSQCVGLTFAAKAYVRGDREGETILYQPDSYPYGAIAKVSFMWRSVSDDKFSESFSNQLWIWSHPSATSDVISALEQSFRMEQKDDESLPTATCLRDELSRFRLTGSQATAVLQKTLRPCEKLVDGSDKSDCYGNGADLRRFEEQNKWWSRLDGSSSPATLPPRLIVGLTVCDPRFVVASGKSGERESTSLNDSASDISVSPLWDKDVRQKVAGSWVTDAEVNNLKSQRVIPGTGTLINGEGTRIPILLSQRPGCRDNCVQGAESYGCGWDVVLPRVWARSLWQALVYQKTRPGGLREIDTVSREMGHLVFPDDFPDTSAGRAEAERLRLELTEKYNRRPPAKRPNYTKLGVSEMFSCPWLKLVRDWKRKLGLSKKDGEASGEMMETPRNVDSEKDECVLNETGQGDICMKIEERACGDGSGKVTRCSETVDHEKVAEIGDEVREFFILRDRKKLRLLNELLKPPVKRNNGGKHVDILSRNDVQVLLNESGDSLVPVMISMKFGGLPERFSMICQPLEKDLTTSESGNMKLMRIQEMVHRDFAGEEKRAERRRKRQESKKSLSKMSQLDQQVMGQLNKEGMEQLDKDVMEELDKLKEQVDEAMKEQFDIDVEEHLDEKVIKQLDKEVREQSENKVMKEQLIDKEMIEVDFSGESKENTNTGKQGMDVDVAGNLLENNSNPRNTGESCSSKLVPSDISSEKTKVPDFKINQISTLKPKLNKTDDVVDSCSRTIIGFINRGAYSFLRGYGAGIGFCPLVALLHHVNEAIHQTRNAAIVLVRNSTSFEYKLGEISIVVAQ